MKFRIKTVLKATQRDAYNLMCSTNSMIKWETNFTGFQPIKGQRRKMGSTGHRIYHEPDGTITKIKEEVTETKKNELLAYQLTHANFMSYITCQFLDQGGQIMMIEDTEVTFRPRILNLIGIFMKGSMRKQRETDLKKFKQLLEAK